MKKRLELRLSTQIFNDLETYKIKNRFEDKQDAIRKILQKELYKKSIFKIILNIFKK